MWTVWVDEYPLQMSLDNPEVGEELDVEGIAVVITSVNRATKVVETRKKR